MSPAAKSWSKTSARAAKEQPKASPKASPSAATVGNSDSTCGYDPDLGTSHNLDTRPSASLLVQQGNSKFAIMDKGDESSSGTTTECDSLSNNGSCSGDSEDHKEKTVASSTPNAMPVPGADTDKRDKVRQNNERKHQRKKERRSQELHDRCIGYLMSWKIEVLAQQLVAMGFTSERATVALTRNEGRVEESVTWLFDRSDEDEQPLNPDTTNLKIDIAEELRRMADLEARFKCTKQEVEMAVVACEGDLGKATAALKAAQKQKPTFAQQKAEKTADYAAPHGISDNPAVPPNPAYRTQQSVAASAIVQQRRKEGGDLSCARPTAAVGGAVSLEAASMNLQTLQSLRKAQTKPSEWPRPTSSLEKRWPSEVSGPSEPYSLASPLQVVSNQVASLPGKKSPSLSEARFAVAGNEVKPSSQSAGMLREPFFVMQRQHSVKLLCNNLPDLRTINTSPAISGGGWYLDTGGNAQPVGGHDLNGLGGQLYHPHRGAYQPFAPGPAESGLRGGGRPSSGASGVQPASAIANPFSLGLFAALSSSGSSSRSSPPLDWSSGGSLQNLDYSSIDWDLDSKPLDSGWPMEERWPPACFAAKAPPSVVATAIGGGTPGFSGFEDSSLFDLSGSVGIREWTSPFEGKDLFRFPKQRFLASPSQ